MLKKFLFFLFLAVVFCSVAVSASQLIKKTPGTMACGNPCGNNRDCARGCLCLFLLDGGEGFCVAPGNSTARSH